MSRYVRGVRRSALLNKPAHSCRILLVARAHLPLSRMPRCNHRHNGRPVSLVPFQILSPLSKESNRKLCIACRTSTRFTNYSRVVTRAHPNRRIRISPSTTCQEIHIPRRRTILRDHCRSSLPQDCSRNWMLRHCSTYFITTPERIHSESLHQLLLGVKSDKF